MEADTSDNRLNAKIRTAQTQKVPYVLVVGEQEQRARGVNLRTRAGERRGMLTLDELERTMSATVAAKAEL